MSEAVEHILLKDFWSDEDRSALRAAFVDDPSLSDMLRNWTSLRGEIRRSMHNVTSGMESFVDYAIATSTVADVFGVDDTRAALSREAEIEAAIARHPAVSVLLESIRDDATVFDLTWNESIRSTRTRPNRTPMVRRSSLRPLVRWSYGIAAGLALVVALSVLLRTDGRNGVSVSSGSTETRVLNLEDGSVVRLMPNSSLDYDEDFGRNMSLSGEAFFDVSHSTSIFTVRTENAVVTVHGTSFGITSRDNETQVTLVAGSVSFSSVLDPSLSVELRPGQSSRILGTGTPSDPVNVDISNALSWTDLFIFRDTPLPQIVNTLSRELDVTIILSSELESETVTGTFSTDQTANEILDVIAAALGARVTYDKATITYTLLP